MAALNERFWSKVDKNGPVLAHRPDLGPCYLWTGALNSHGYGQFWDGERMRPAHAVSWEMKHGPVPPGLEPDHLCRVHNCVNDSHLEPVTRRENIMRGIGPAKLALINGAKTHCPAGHAYAGANLHIRPDGRRRCRACDRAATRNRRAA